MRGKRVWAGVMAALLAGPVFAIFKCTGSDGQVTYTDTPCAASSQAKTIEVPPPPGAREEADARRRGERLVHDAQALDARQSREAAERQRRWEIERQAEAVAQQRQSQRDEAEHLAVIYPTPLIGRRWPPVKPVVPKQKPVAQERLGRMQAYPFR